MGLKLESDNISQKVINEIHVALEAGKVYPYYQAIYDSDYMC